MVTSYVGRQTALLAYLDELLVNVALLLSPKHILVWSVHNHIFSYNILFNFICIITILCSGLLVMYTNMSKKVKNNGETNWFKYYFHRFWR